MSSLQEIESAISRLTPEDLRKFREWFAEHEAKGWDEQFERDVAAGNDRLVANQ